MKLLTLFVRYGDKDYAGAFQRLCKFYQRIEGLDYDAMLIDTAIPVGLEVPVGPNITLIGGDNGRREFSGWDTALARYPTLLDGYDLVHVVTSAFENEYNGFYPYVRRDMFDFVAANPEVVLAHIDAYPDAARLFGRSFQTWGCSKFLLAVPERIRRIGTFTGPFDIDALFPKDKTGAPFLADAPLSSNYQAHLVNWLTGDGLPHGKWHSVFEMSHANVDRFRSKAISIADEHSLSMRIRETGGVLVDFTWLYASGVHVEPQAIPDEIDQVRQRNAFLFDNPIIERALDTADATLNRDLGALFRVSADDATPFGRSPVVEALWRGNRVLQEQFDPNRPLHCAAIHLNQGISINTAQLAWLAKPDDNLPQDTLLPLTRGLHACYLSRDDLRDSFSLDDAAGRARMISWWMLDGIRDDRYRGFIPGNVYSASDPAVEQDLPLPITRGLNALVHARDDLLEAANPSTQAGRRALVRWWLTDGFFDPPLAPCMPARIYTRVSWITPQDAVLPVTIGLLALHAVRDDLSVFDVSTPEGRDQLVCWWVLFGKPERSDFGIIDGAVYSEPDERIPQDAKLPITRGLHALWRARTDLRAAFDIGSPEGRRKLIAWWLLEGAHVDAFDEFMRLRGYHEPATDVPQDGAIPITRAMAALCASRDDLAKFDCLRTAESRAAFLEWWFREMALGNLPHRLLPGPALLGIHPVDPKAADADVHPLALAIWRHRSDLQQAFDIATAKGRVALAEWLYKYGRNEIRLSSAADAAARAEGWLDGSASTGTGTSRGAAAMAEIRAVKNAKAVDSRERMAGHARREGVNVLGFARGELGIGEDVRMAARALRTLDVDFCAPRIPLAIGARQQDNTLAAYEVDVPLYRTNLIFLPHYETIRLVGASGNRLLGDRYNIACWQWELPTYPRGMELALEPIDEIWSSTAFTARAMRQATDKPVLVMPMAVVLPSVERTYRREDFGLPDDAFVFLNILDGNSSVHRKNPLAVVRAFRRAFAGHQGVHLVIKTMNMVNAPAQWDKALALCAGDERITVIAEAFPREAVIGLQSVCDCFVSLHRAEGFGRNIAEAMLLGKPVIASDFSGNTDFTRPDTAFMVGGETIPVRPGEYGFADGQFWLDADVGVAAQRMLEVCEDAAARNARADAGRIFVENHYAPEAVGARYRERLIALHAMGGE